MAYGVVVMASENSKILVEISPAELIDKICVLEIKSKKITDPEKNKNIQHELNILKCVFNTTIAPSEELNQLINELKAISQRGWENEEIKRAHERENDFGPKFIKAACDAFKNNDERAAVWKKINVLLKSNIIQEKSY
jgi:hypothetical protein